ncbi:MAG: hypothetical protein GOU99_03920 [Candidatus Altiarchaeota archaeon]|nr:hypothetical protein [Candidatus Altiarchaeota archaeon]
MSKATIVFLLIHLMGLIALPAIQGIPNLEEYRPSGFELGQEEQASITLFSYMLYMTLGLVLLKLVGFKLSWVIDFSVLMMGVVFGSLIRKEIELGLVLLAYRKSGSVLLYNISSILTILFFGLLFSPFMTPDSVMLLFALLSLYDVIGVLYAPYIKFLWLEVKKKIRTDGVAILFENGMIGAGDFIIPLLFVLSYGVRGWLAVPFVLFGFVITEKLAKRFNGFPGIPIQAFCAYLFYALF